MEDDNFYLGLKTALNTICIIGCTHCIMNGTLHLACHYDVAHLALNPTCLVKYGITKDIIDKFYEKSGSDPNAKSLFMQFELTFCQHVGIPVMPEIYDS